MLPCPNNERSFITSLLPTLILILFLLLAAHLKWTKFKKGFSAPNSMQPPIPGETGWLPWGWLGTHLCRYAVSTLSYIIIVCYGRKQLEGMV